MNPHRPKKPASDEYTTDEEEMIVYDVEDEIETNPDVRERKWYPQLLKNGKIEKVFLQRWNFPRCCGAIDGKHVLIKRPPVQVQHNTTIKRKTYSIILFGLWWMLIIASLTLM
ncbi:hypothetical protein TNCV_3346901 [Trichonephila clavipes]|nr:hypothetical protein TNCV_3346901 [Trichonephila clavipes]